MCRTSSSLLSAWAMIGAVTRVAAVVASVLTNALLGLGVKRTIDETNAKIVANRTTRRHIGAVISVSSVIR